MLISGLGGARTFCWKTTDARRVHSLSVYTVYTVYSMNMIVCVCGMCVCMGYTSIVFNPTQTVHTFEVSPCLTAS